MPTGQLNDEILAAQVAQGDRSALEALYDRYAGNVLGICLKITGDRALAEDILQETFLRVWQSAVTEQPERGTFAEWLFRTARNLAIGAYRRRNAHPQAIREMMDANPIPAEGAERMQDLLAALPLEQRQVIEMAYFYGMTRQQIAEATGQSLDVIQALARLGLQKLYEELDRSQT